MPIAQVAGQQVYFAHIPKCAGTSIEDYLIDRFGPLALLDRQHLSLAEDARWSRTSPQHIDWQSLCRLFPEGSFDHVFAVVRHPVARAVSAYRFQSEVESAVDQDMSFTAWLQAEYDLRKTHPHRSDNHSRPQSDFLPPVGGQPCQIFYLEHGLDALIPYFDQLAGNTGAPRFMDHSNKAASKPAKAAAIVPTKDDIALLAQMFAADFERFGYDPEQPKPMAAAPDIDTDFLAEAARAKRQAARPVRHFLRRVGGRLRKL